MFPHEIDHIRQSLPETLAFPYYADRESPWLLSRRLTAPARVADLRKGPLSRYLDRPLVRPVVAECGGVLDPADLWLVAHADIAASRDLGRPALAGAIAAFDVPWHDFQLTLDRWGVESSPSWAQISRAGGNLVLQLGFPGDHAYLMAQHSLSRRRKEFEYPDHPIRTSGRPTLAWARLDVDGDAGVALIEEVQSDWLRFVAEVARRRARNDPQARDTHRTLAYRADLEQRYGRIWPRAMLLAAVSFLADELGIRDIWMHQPQSGALYKQIRDRQPPVSLYTALPRSFGFDPVAEVPPFLARYKRRSIAKLRRRGVPVFWRLSLPQDGGC